MFELAFTFLCHPNTFCLVFHFSLLPSMNKDGKHEDYQFQTNALNGETCSTSPIPLFWALFFLLVCSNNDTIYH